MSLLFRQALRYIASFVRRESKPVNHSAVPLKNRGPSCGSFVGSSSVHTTATNKQTLQKLASDPYKGIPKSTNINTRYLNEESPSLFSVITSSGIGATVKDEQKIQGSKSWYCKETLKSVQEGISICSAIESARFKPAVVTQQTFRCFGTRTGKTTQPLKKDGSLLGYFTGAFNVGSTTECNQISRRYSSNNCKKKRKKDPCKKPPPPRKGSIGCLVGPSGVYPTLEGSYKLWRNVTFLVCLPILILWTFTVFTTYEEPKRPEFRKYEYMRKRTKKFPWCGGTDRSFFHNPHLNALPDGYEEDNDE